MKQVLVKARFLEKEYYPTKKTYPQDAKNGVEIVFTKLQASRNAVQVQTLLLTKPVKNFALDKDEGVWEQ